METMDHLKEPAIFPVDKVTEKSLNCLPAGRQWLCLCLSSWIMLDKSIIETIYVGRWQPMIWRIEYLTAKELHSWERYSRCKTELSQAY